MSGARGVRRRGRPLPGPVAADRVGFGQQVIINRMLKSKDDEAQPPTEKDRAGSRPKKSLMMGA